MGHTHFYNGTLTSDKKIDDQVALEMFVEMWRRVYEINKMLTQGLKVELDDLDHTFKIDIKDGQVKLYGNEIEFVDFWSGKFNEFREPKLIQFGHWIYQNQEITSVGTDHGLGWDEEHLQNILDFLSNFGATTYQGKVNYTSDSGEAAIISIDGDGKPKAQYLVDTSDSN